MVEYSSEREQGALFLPPGFRFHPTDEEIISSYLLHKFLNPSFTSRAVGDVDLNKCEPWDLPSKAKMGEKEWYFFCQKDMKYPTGMRANRATKEGYWKATGKDKEIFDKGRVLVGMKKTLVFYRGRAPRGAKTNWVMHEFRLDGDGSNLRINPKDEWVVCKVFHKKGGVKKTMEAGIPVVSSVDGGGDDDLIDSMIDPAYFNPSNLPNTTNGGAASAVAGGAVASSFLPSYSFNSSNQVVMSNSMPTSTSAAPQSYYSYLHDHQAMVNALGGVIHPNFGVSKGFSESSPVGVPPRNSVCVPQQKLGGYGTPYAASCLISTSTGTSTTTIGVAPNLGAHQVHY